MTRDEILITQAKTLGEIRYSSVNGQPYEPNQGDVLMAILQTLNRIEVLLKEESIRPL